MGNEEKYKILSEGKVSFHEVGADRALIQLARAYHQRSAMREFASNSLDARIRGVPGNVGIIINPSDRRVIISDDCQGIPYENFVKLPGGIGNSMKVGKGKVGEKALGLLAFGSLGDSMHIISKPYEGKDEVYFYQRWEILDDKQEIKFKNMALTPKEVESSFYGIFPHGTRIIIDNVKKHIMDNKIGRAHV